MLVNMKLLRYINGVRLRVDLKARFQDELLDIVIVFIYERGW